MMYGNSSMGYAYSPDNSRNVNHSNLNSQFLGASGSRQGGYYFSASNKKESNGTWKQSGSGAWYKD
jgi:hypothetical protein